MYTLENVNTAQSYPALKRKGFTDAQMVEYYNFADPIDRKRFFARLTQPQRAPKKVMVVPSYTVPHTEKRGTQMCPSFLQQVKEMATIKMNTTFRHQGVEFNAIEENYKLVFTNNKSTFGRHVIRRRGFLADTNKSIELSQWMIENSKEDDMDLWIDTILHEIAHAIDHKMRGTSDHQWQWKQIAITVGCKPSASARNETVVGASKYTITCPKCGNQRNGHKFSRAIAQGRKSCGKCSLGYFSKDRVLIQTQNY